MFIQIKEWLVLVGVCTAVGMIDCVLKNSVAFLTENWDPSQPLIMRSDKLQGQLLLLSIEPFNLFHAVR